MSLDSFVKSTRQTLQDNAPSILAALAVGGIATTGIVAYNVGYETGREAEFLNAQGEEPLTGKEKFQRYWKTHLPIFVLGGVTAVCVISGTAIGNRRNAILGGTLAITETTFREYKEKVEKVVTKQKRDQVDKELAEDKLDRTDNEIVFVGDGKILCFDTLTSRFFESTKLDIQKAELEINRRLLSDMYVSQNEWYDEIGLSRVASGDAVGWNHDVPLEVKFVPLMKDDKPVMGLDYRFLPSVAFDRFG